MTQVENDTFQGLFVSTVQHQSMRSTSNGFHQQKMWPDFLCFLFTVFIGGWSRLDSRLLGTMLEFLLWLIVHKNDEFVGKVKPSRVLTSATLILIVLDAEQRKSWYLSSWRSFRASWFFFMGSSSSSEYDLWFLLYFKQQPRWPCVFSTDP